MLLDHLGNPIKSLDSAIHSAETAADVLGANPVIDRRTLLLGGLGLLAAGCGAGQVGSAVAGSLDGRISLKGSKVDAEFEEFVNVIREYAHYRATSKRKPGRKPGEIGDLLRNYIIRQNKRPVTKEYLGEINMEISNFTKLNKYLIKGNVFLTRDSFKGTPIINIY